MFDGDWPQTDAKALVIELAFSNPFAPYELSFRDGDLTRALVNVAKLVGLDAGAVDQIRDTQQDALKAHRHINWQKIAVYGGDADAWTYLPTTIRHCRSGATAGADHA